MAGQTMYLVQGSWDGINWWANKLHGYTEQFKTPDLAAAISAAVEYTKARQFKHRRVVDGGDVVMWHYKPKDGRQ